MMDCTYNGRYHWITCFGIQHTLMAVSAVVWAGAVHPWSTPGVAVAVSAGFVIHELRGKGNLFSSADRFFDWFLPLAVSLGTAAAFVL